MHFFHLLLSAATLAAPATLPQYDRRSRDEPEIVVEAGGRSGTCDALLFDRTGQFLFAGGDDKVVRVWPYSGGKLDVDRTTTLRWRAWREQRGGIKAVAVSPDGLRVAVGGYGMKPATVAVLDRTTRELLGLTWPSTEEGGENVGPVTAIAFHPDGKGVGFGTADGSLWWWQPELLDVPDRDGRPSPLPRRLGQHRPQIDEKEKPTAFNLPRLIAFLDNDTLLSVAQSGEVVTCAIAPTVPPGSGLKTLFNMLRNVDGRPEIRRAVVTPNGKWLVAAELGTRIRLWSIDKTEEVRRIELPDDHFPRSIAVHPVSGRLAVGVGAALPKKEGQPRFYAEGNDDIWLYDDPTRGGQPTKMTHRGPAEELAFHPTEDRLAVAGGDSDEVTILDLAKQKPLSMVRGAGRRLWGVALSENGKVLGVQSERDATSIDPNTHGAGTWARFDIPRLTPTRDESREWVKQVRTANGWSIVPSVKSRYIWHAAWADDGPRDDNAIPLDQNRDHAPTCYAFLPAVANRPTRVLIGHEYGCSLFELTPNQPPKRTKLFTGHAGEVLSLAVAKDGTWFVTGGADNTVAAWSLTDWPSQAGLGAKFEARRDRVEVTAVDTGSPAYEAGLRVGDVLELLAVNGERVFDRRSGKQPYGTPGKAADALLNPQPGIELFFGWVPAGGGPLRQSLTTVRQRPVWKWFPAFDDRGRMTDWVIWMWQGSYYHTKSAHGDRLVGWHVNNPIPSGRSEFYQLERFEKQFHRPEVIEKLVNTLDVAAALSDARQGNPLPESFTQFEPAPVRLSLPQTVVAEDGLPLTITVRPRGNNPDLLPDRVELWVNDYRHEVWSGNDRQLFQKTLTIPAGVFRTGENRITVLTLNPAGGRAEDTRAVTNPRQAVATNIRALMVGVDDYSQQRKNATGTREAFGDLTCAGRDARGLADTFLTFRGPTRWFRGGEIELRLGPDAGRAQLLRAIAATAELANPDDLLVLFFAGHGDLLRPAAGRGVVAAGARGGSVAGGGEFMLCCPNYSPLHPTDTALSADEVFDALARAKCRKVVLLDACHSGQAAEANVLRRFIPAGQGPFVIAACDQSEQSYEHPKLGHGVFTAAILEALGKRFGEADTDTNGELSADELYAYITRRVPGLLREIGKSDDTQNPICFPRTPPKFTIVKP
jgi:WD40 repeat protein